jgi:hypothetical protein
MSDDDADRPPEPSKAPTPQPDAAERRAQARARDDARRRKAMHALAGSVERVTKQALGRRALAEAGLIADWPSIVGADVARVCLPRRLSFPHAKTRREGTLVLRVAPGEATRLAHQEPVLVERVNGYFGYQAVARLRLEQGPLPERGRRPRAPAAPALSDTESQAAERRIAQVADDDLRAALTRLGRRLSGRDD